METIPCLFCHRQRHTVVIREHGYSGVKCFACGLIYLSPRPTASEIWHLYNPAEAATLAPPLTNYRRFTGFVKSLPARYTTAIIKTYLPAGRLLEIGPGDGHFLATFQKAGFTVSGLEVNRRRAEFIRTGLKIPCLSEPLSHPVWNRKSFDLIYHRDVLSHFSDPLKEFHLMHQRLDAGGFLGFETGNLADVEEKYYAAFPTFDYPEHLFFFGRQSLARLLGLTGFEVAAIYNYSILPTLYLEKYIARRRLKKRQGRTPSLPAAPPASPVTARPGLKNYLKKSILTLYDLLSEYFLKYRLGRLLPKSGRPQTLIVVARKR